MSAVRPTPVPAFPALRAALAPSRQPAHRYPCTDPHRTGCTATSGQKHRACPDCNRQRANPGRFRAVPSQQLLPDV